MLRFLDTQGISKSLMYRATGISNGMLDKPSGVSEKNVELFLNAYPDVRVKWLIIGEEPMLESEHQELQKLEEPAADYGAGGRVISVVSQNNDPCTLWYQ